MTRQAYESDPVPFSLPKELYRQGGPNDYLPYVENPTIKDQAVNLEGYMNLVRKNDDRIKVPTMLGSYNSLLSKTFFLPINKNEILAKGVVPKEMEDLIPERMVFRLKRNGLEKNTLMILDMILANDWERPIYFNNTSLQNAGIDFREYVVQEGNAYRLLPIRRPDLQEDVVNVDIMYDNMMNKFYFREMDNPNVYYSEDYRNFALNHRSTFNTLAEALLQKGDTERARMVLNRSLEVMPDEAIPYDYSNVQTASLLFRVGESDKAMIIAEKLGVNAEEFLAYYMKYGNGPQNEIQKHLTVLSLLSRMLKNEEAGDLATQLEEAFVKYYNMVSQ
jgi:hypothetical protein